MTRNRILNLGVHSVNEMDGSKEVMKCRGTLCRRSYRVGIWNKRM